MAQLQLESWSGAVEAGTTAPTLVLRLVDDAGRTVDVSGGRFTISVAGNQRVRLVEEKTFAAKQGEVHLAGLSFATFGTGVRLEIRAAGATVATETFDVVASKPLVSLLSTGVREDGCSTLEYSLQQAQSAPVDLTVEYRVHGGAQPYHRATQGPSAPGEAGVSGLASSAAPRTNRFVWNHHRDLGSIDGWT